MTPESGDLPRRIMADVYWRFDGEPFESEEALNDAVHQYQIRNWHESSWQPDQIQLPLSQVCICYELGAEEPIVTLVAENGQSFSAGELLFQIHNAVVEQLRDRDHRYFEGFRLREEKGPKGIPLYEMATGS